MDIADTESLSFIAKDRGQRSLFSVFCGPFPPAISRTDFSPCCQQPHGAWRFLLLSLLPLWSMIYGVWIAASLPFVLCREL